MPKNWKTLGKVLTFKEKFIVAALLLIIAVSFVVWIGSFYLNLTKAVPKAGGEYIEGLVGQPLYLNPLLSQTSEADSDLSSLIYSSLFKYDQSGNVINDLADSYTVSDDQKEYTISIKKGVTWHDGKTLNANDVFFTYNILQDPSYKSPLRQGLQGVDIRLLDDYTIVFSLKNPYTGFLENLTVGILPKHIWENIAPEKFALAENNLHPIGSGPYMFSTFQKDTDGNILTLQLSAFKQYYQGSPYISKFTFNFYPDDSSLIDAYNKKEIMGMGSIPPENIKDIKNAKSTNIHEFIIPRYFSIFFNQTKNVALANDSVRLALSMGVDRQQLIDAILHGKGIALTSPIFPQMNGYKDENNSKIDIEGAKKILDDAGWVLDNSTGVRKKGSTSLAFELVTTDWPELNQTADLLKQQWAKIGADVTVRVLTVSDLQQNYIRTREYDSLLFGQAISFNPDLYSFWHSSQKHDPGLNLSLFENKDADGVLEDLRQQTDQSKRVEDYQKLQDILAKEVPAVFLYSRNYLYPANTNVQGITAQNINNPTGRFTDVNKWYVKTSRVLK
ncbi:MAG: ABC transporter substrate-binding protein [Candidatus Moranbacteria bacterium]|nr:ABC transporter substrate-binding protein [Candidatus Moranbacteria bacterium]